MSTNDASDYTLAVFKSASIVSELRKNFPTIAALLNYNRSGTVELLKANGALHMGLIRHRFKVGHSGDNDGVKVWTDFQAKIKAYVDLLIAEVAPRYREQLNHARIKLSEYIYQQYFIELPYWPDVGETNVACVELNITGTYKYGSVMVVWSCVGVITVTDKRPRYYTFDAQFTGRPDIKVAFIDYDKVRKLESVLSQKSIDDAKRLIDRKQRERGRNYLTWDQLK